MANTILRVETSNTFDQWRIVTNTLVNAVNELRNNTFIKDTGGLTVSNGSIIVTKGNIQVVNGTLQLDKTTGETLYVAADARVGGNLIVTSGLTVSGANVFESVLRANAAFNKANNAANTVRVTANSGTAQSAVSLNFNNTSTILVSVGAGSTGNANVSFIVVPTFPSLNVSGISSLTSLNVSADTIVTGNLTAKNMITLDTAVKTSSFNATANRRYMTNTAAAAMTMTLPSTPTVGDRVAVVDYSRTFTTNNLTIGRNAKLIMGLDEDLVCDIDGISIDLMYTDTTRGWILI